MAQDDSDQWVAMVGDILKTYPSTGNLNAEVDESQNFFHEVVIDLKKLGKLFLPNHIQWFGTTVFKIRRHLKPSLYSLWNLIYHIMVIVSLSHHHDHLLTDHGLKGYCLNAAAYDFCTS